MSNEEKNITPEEWEQEVKERINEYLTNLLSIAENCNMATKYFYAPKEVFESHIEYDNSKVKGAELKIVFNFVEDIDIDKINFT